MKISDIRLKNKSPFRAYFNRTPIWWKYHEKTQAIFDYALQNGYTLPTNKIAYDDYIRKIASNGLFGKNDFRYIYCGDGDINFKLTNIINPGTYNSIAYGGLMWDNSGVKGNGVNGWMEMLYSNHPENKYQLIDACKGFVVDIADAVSPASTNVSAGTPRGLISVYNSRLKEINRLGTIPNFNWYNNGFKALLRNSENSIEGVNKDILQVWTEDSSGDLVIERPWRLFVENNNYALLKLSTYFIGGYITYEETQLERQFFNEYLIDLGLEPIA